jgi:hypothetical protein
MPTLAKYKNVLIAIVVACLLYLGYVYLWPTDGDVPLLGSTTGALENAVDTELLTVLAQTRQIDLDSTLFESAVFKSLQDIGQTISAQPLGRENPFAPLPGSSVSPLRR